MGKTKIGEGWTWFFFSVWFQKAKKSAFYYYRKKKEYCEFIPSPSSRRATLAAVRRSEKNPKQSKQSNRDSPDQDVDQQINLLFPKIEKQNPTENKQTNKQKKEPEER